jgi:hypothetical protein
MQTVQYHLLLLHQYLLPKKTRTNQLLHKPRLSNSNTPLRVAHQPAFLSITQKRKLPVLQHHNIKILSRRPLLRVDCSLCLLPTLVPTVTQLLVEQPDYRHGLEIGSSAEPLVPVQGSIV